MQEEWTGKARVRSQNGTGGGSGGSGGCGGIEDLFRVESRGDAVVRMVLRRKGGGAVRGRSELEWFWKRSASRFRCSLGPVCIEQGSFKRVVAEGANTCVMRQLGVGGSWVADRDRDIFIIMTIPPRS